MASKDYYILLGVPRTASVAEIRDAFRELAKRYHPDRTGSEGTAHFQDIVKAYEVLSDPEKRQQYNQDLPHAEPIRPRGAEKAWRAQPEPFLTDITPLRSWHEGYATFADPLAPFWERRSRHGFRAPERPERLHVTVTLCRDEAVQGGRLPLTVPAVSVCLTCCGIGHSWYFLCSSCGGHGTLATPYTVYVRIPPQIRDGSILEVSLDPYGLPCVLHIHIRVDPQSL